MICCRVSELTDQSLDLINQIISHDEQLRLQRFRFKKDQKRYAAARLLQYLGLSQLLDMQPSEMIFDKGPHGKPLLKNVNPKSRLPLPLDFNLSHSGDWAVAAFSPGKIGIDVENRRRTNDVLAIADRYFFAKELADMLAVAGNERESFFKLWTLKEAYIKARGEGLSLGLDNFGFVRDDESASRYRLVCSEKIRDTENWWFDTVELDQDHQLALVTNTELTNQEPGCNAGVFVRSHKLDVSKLNTATGDTFSDIQQCIRYNELNHFKS